MNGRELLKRARKKAWTCDRSLLFGLLNRNGLRTLSTKAVLQGYALGSHFKKALLIHLDRAFLLLDCGSLSGGVGVNDPALYGGTRIDMRSS